MHGTSARFLIVVASAYTAGLQLFSPTSLAYRAAGEGWLIDAVNIAVLILAAFAAADLLWHNILRRGLILPSYPMRKRHQVCVVTYSMLAGAFGIRAFIVTGDSDIAPQVGAYYVLVATGIAIEAAAIAFEKREDACPTESDSA